MWLFQGQFIVSPHIASCQVNKAIKIPVATMFSILSKGNVYFFLLNQAKLCIDASVI